MRDLFSPCGVITLTTDFGLSDPFVGVMKGVILSRHPNARIVDITHSIQPQSVAEASFWLTRSYQYFPSGSVHVAVVDPGVGSDRRIVALLSGNHILLAPDNGLIADITSIDSSAQWVVVDPDVIDGVGLPSRSSTFHGRDIFAPLAAELAARRMRFEDLGSPTTTIVTSLTAQPIASDTSVVGTIVTIDHFGNLLTNIDASLLQRFSKSKMIVAGLEYPFVRTYSDAATGEVVGLLNAFSVLEIARVGGNAAVHLNLGRGTTVTLKSQSD